MKHESFATGSPAAKPFPAKCADGRHRSRLVLARSSSDVLRSTCRSCGCELVRTRATRIWIRSGELG